MIRERHFLLLLLVIPLMTAACSDDETPGPVAPPVAPEVRAPAFFATWGTQGNGDGQFESPYGIAVGPNGRIYVADTGNNRIQVFDGNRTFVTAWGSAGTGDGEFNGPSGIAVDADNFVYVTDRFNHRVQQFSGDGVFITKWGVEGSGDGQFQDPMGIACDGNGNVLVADGGAQVFDRNGVFQGQISGRAYGIACDAKGNVYLADYSNSAVRKYDLDSGSLLGVVARSGDEEHNLFHPTMIACNHDSGILYVADGDHNRIQMYDGDDAFVDNWGTFGTRTGGFDRPTGVAIDADGYVYVADTGNHRIQVFK